MPLTELETTCALVVIDLQAGIVSRPTVHTAYGIVDRAAALAKAFRQHGRPVVLVNVSGMAPGRNETPRPPSPPAPGWDILVPELDAQDGDIRITKRCWGAFLGTHLHEQLQQLSVTQIVLAGISTSIGVESTARSAFDLGYNVVFAIDAMTDTVESAHRNSLETIFPRLGETATTEEIMMRLSNQPAA